jgi:hypothetical protein
MPSYPPRPGLIAACLSSHEALSSVIDVLEVVELSRERAWLQLSVPLAAATSVFIRLCLPDVPEHVAAGEVLWSVRDPGKPGHFTGVRFTPPLAEEVLRRYVDMP